MTSEYNNDTIEKKIEQNCINGEIMKKINEREQQFKLNKDALKYLSDYNKPERIWILKELSERQKIQQSDLLGVIPDATVETIKDVIRELERFNYVKSEMAREFFSVKNESQRARESEFIITDLGSRAYRYIDKFYEQTANRVSIPLNPKKVENFVNDMGKFLGLLENIYTIKREDLVQGEENIFERLFSGEAPSFIHIKTKVEDMHRDAINSSNEFASLENERRLEKKIDEIKTKINLCLKHSEIIIEEFKKSKVEELDNTVNKLKDKVQDSICMRALAGQLGQRDESAVVEEIEK